MLIGVNAYEDTSSFRPLKYALADISELKSLISDPQIGEFDSNNIVILKDPTDAEMRLRLDQVLSAASATDSVFIYFAGHGKTDRVGRLCLAARNTKSDVLHGTSLHLDSMKAMLDNSPARRIILVMDCCFSGAVGETLRGGDMPTNHLEEMSGEGKIIISSSRQFEVARELDEFGHGVFAHFLLNGLRTGDADIDRDGKISIDELFHYVEQGMRDRRFPQTPMRWGGMQTGDIYIGKSMRVLRQKQEESQRVEQKKERILSLYLSGIVPVTIYNRALPLLDLKSGEGTEKDRALLHIVEDALAERMALPVFVQSWGLIEKSNPKDAARTAFKLAEERDNEASWNDYLKRYGGVEQENDRLAQERLRVYQRHREEQVPQEAADYERAKAENTPAAWRSFLDRYPESPRKQEVLERFVVLGGRDRSQAAQTAFDRARLRNTLEAWTAYLDEWRGAAADHDLEAEKRLRELQSSVNDENQAYETARKGGLLADWEKFIQAFPDSPHRTEVLSRISTLQSPISAVHATAWRRVAADFIDSVAVLLTLFLILVVYLFVIRKTGRTLGHKIMRTRILNKQQTHLSFGRSFAYLFSWSLWWLVWLFLAGFVTAILEDIFHNSLDFLPITALYIVWFGGPFLGTAFFVWKTTEHRAPYDYLAGIIVVQDQPSKRPAKILTPTPGPWQRFAADLVDAVSLLAAPGFLALVGLLLQREPQEPTGVFAELSRKSFSLAEILGKRDSFLAFAALWFCFYVFVFSRFGQTLGSNALGYRLLRHDRSAPGWSNAVRYAGCLLLICLIAFYPPSLAGILAGLALTLLNPLLVHKWQRSLFDVVAGTQALRLQSESS